jgi:HEAT repeats
LISNDRLKPGGEELTLVFRLSLYLGATHFFWFKPQFHQCFADLGCHAELFEVCMQALAGEDEPVRETAVDALGALAGSAQHAAGLEQILALQKDESPHMRVRVAYALKHFDDSAAKDALTQLRQDADHRVVGATMENLLP